MSLTLAQARQACLDDAFSKAIAEAVGIQISSETVGSKLEVMSSRQSENRYSDLFAIFSRTTTYGRVIRYDILSERIETIKSPSNAVSYIMTVDIECEVAKDEGKPDPSLQLNLSLNKEVYQVNATGEGEQIIISVESSLDGFATIFNIADDTVSVLLPNQIVRENKISGGILFDFPSAKHRASGLELTASLDPGKARNTEWILCIVTKDPVPFSGTLLEKGTGFLPTITSARNELMRWISKIPPSRRTEAWKSYEVRRK